MIIYLEDSLKSYDNSVLFRIDIYGEEDDYETLFTGTRNDIMKKDLRGLVVDFIEEENNIVRIVAYY